MKSCLYSWEYFSKTPPIFSPFSASLCEGLLWICLTSEETYEIIICAAFTKSSAGSSGSFLGGSKGQFWDTFIPPCWGGMFAGSLIGHCSGSKFVGSLVGLSTGDEFVGSPFDICWDNQILNLNDISVNLFVIYLNCHHKILRVC